MALSGMSWTHPYMAALQGKPGIGLESAHIAFWHHHPDGVYCTTSLVVFASSESRRCNWVVHHAGGFCVVVLWQQEFPC